MYGVHCYSVVLISNSLQWSVKHVGVSPTGAAAAVFEVSERIQDNAQQHENHLQLCRVQKLLKGRKTKVLAAG